MYNALKTSKQNFPIFILEFTRKLCLLTLIVYDATPLVFYDLKLMISGGPFYIVTHTLGYQT